MDIVDIHKDINDLRKFFSKFKKDDDKVNHHDDMVNHPPHYNNSKSKCSCGKRIECIDVTRHLGFNIGNAIKYLWRCDLKNSPIEDLHKAIWYIQDEINSRLLSKAKE